MQIKQQSNSISTISFFRRILNVIQPHEAAMKGKYSPDPCAGQSTEWNAGFASYFAFNPKNPHPPASMAHGEWELGFNEAERCAAW